MQPDTAGSWTPVALSADLPAGTVMPAHIPAGTIALWRSESGRPAATANRCPHRGMSLSHGFVRGESLSCIYHGWSYAQAGNCIRIPAHPGLEPPETIRAKTFTVEEAGGVIWVATDEPASKPPLLDGLTPLRSMTTDAGLAAIEAAAGAKASAEGLVVPVENADTLCLLVSARDDGQTLIHLLTKGEANPAARIAASHVAENLRRAAEVLQKKEIAA
ncbi:MAG TPA: Rieske (2Fe-2S) protein [Pararhizobium sp.]|uniref:Rieske (2Fe-2S) protein n=1 Tax=Pararhizobium sp. TaxID=1977563 RepID=UPI002D0F97F4|nr:Rieske (2Fe-2S) protein [Pararhizobium sp.]HTO30554.1 Rieske (2Fe-2S) protein [Pararhizobium sp.]